MVSIKYLVCISTISILLLFCSSDNTMLKYTPIVDSSDSSIDVKYNYTIKGNSTDEFSMIISNNPIDTEYEKMLETYDGSTAMIIEYAVAYRDWWHLEMEAAYSQLVDVLDDEDYQNLMLSQISWEEYMISKKNMEANFYYNHSYGMVGELRKALSASEEAEETKARAYSLLEYLYIITGEINLVFIPDK